MLQNKTIHSKITLIVVILTITSLLSVFVGWFSLNKIEKSSDAINKIQNTIQNNKKIVILHEQFIGNMCRSVVKNEKFKESIKDKLEIFEHWYNNFRPTKEYKSLPINIKISLEKVISLHTRVIEISKNYKQNYVYLDENLKNMILKDEVEYLNLTMELSNSLLLKKVANVETNHLNRKFEEWNKTFIKSNQFLKKNSSIHKNIVALSKTYENFHKNVFKIIELQKQGRYQLAQDIYNTQTLGYVSNIQRYFNNIKKDINKLEEKNKIIENEVIVEAPKDFSVIISSLKQYGDYLSKQIKDYEAHMINTQKVAYTFMLLTLLLLILGIVISILVSKNIHKSLKNIIFSTEKLKKQDHLVHIEVSGDDELSMISKNINDYLDVIKNGLDQDEILIKEVEDIIEKVNNGFYNYQVKGKAHNKSVESLKNTLNSMIFHTHDQINVIVHALAQYGQSNFDYEIPYRQDMNGSFGSLVASTKLIGNNVSELLAMIMNSGDKLNLDTNTLSIVSNDLSLASNQQASSLEETAAALEEITSTIKNNTKNINHMSEISNNLTESAINGLDLATKTTLSMDDINNEIDAISKAIKVIDQISFQTNILSLNAAVEAATAGEAGKGFAVVAQEVRSLASRSSEAANQIKYLVDSATKKANHGKHIAENMIKGYHQLNDKINTTSNIVNDVTIASKEQEIGINQINDSISILDSITQKNAATASSISNLSEEVSSLSTNLVTAASRAKFIEKARCQVCDIDMIFDFASLKNDHISFKTDNFNKLGENKLWRVTNSHDCKFGHWIDEQERNSIHFTKSENWKELKKIHNKVHEGVQKYIDCDSKKLPNEILEKISSNIEKDTINLFNHLNNVKIENCENKVKKLGRSYKNCDSNCSLNCMDT